MRLISLTSAAFVAIALAVYWALPSRARHGFLAATGFAYYTLAAPVAGLLTAAHIALVYAMHRRIAATRDRPHTAEPPLFIGCVVGLLPLVVFKYRAFLFAPFTGDSHAPFASIAIPLGISYFTFRLLHVLIDTSQGKLDRVAFFDFFYYVTFWPTLTAGPIERFERFDRQRRELSRFDAALFAEGLQRIVHGLAKKLVLAEAMHVTITDYLADPTVLTAGQLWYATHAYFLYLYFDFSGYSDIAIGISRLFGFRIMENFHWPIFATNLRDFWRRWHISLTGWLTEYVYIGLGGSRRGEWRTAANAMATMILIGLWHGADDPLHFTLWGAFMGAGLVVFRQWRRLRAPGDPAHFQPSRAGILIGWFLTVETMCVGWPLFIFKTETAWRVLSRMFGWG
ncbi:MBOAT family protein [bacterium]|nr:MBOAT family protein [bacterium]